MPIIEFRSATPGDAAECVVLRGRTRENAISAERLAAMGITARSWGDDIRTGASPGHVCVSEGRIVGYCFGARLTGEIVVLALLPDFARQGLGRRLLDLVVADLINEGRHRLFLGCSADPATRSHGFYRHLGWQSTGGFDQHGDEILEYFAPAGRR